MCRCLTPLNVVLSDIVHAHDKFWIMVANGKQRGKLTLYRRIRFHPIGYLDINFLIPADAREIDFTVIMLADERVISATLHLPIDYIFQCS